MKKMWVAMLDGAKMGPQLFNEQVRGNASCAAGAIRLGRGLIGSGSVPEIELGGSVWYSPATCPVGPCSSFTSGPVSSGYAPSNVGDCIVHLNNDHRWSRQRIATEFLLPIEEKWLKQHKTSKTDGKTQEKRETQVKG